MEQTKNKVQEFMHTVEDKRKDDIHTLLKLFETLSGFKPVMWGSIVGFGNLHYKYKSGHEGTMPLIGFANRKQAITLYIVGNTSEYPELENLGKHKTSKACIYINKLSDIKLDVLTEIIEKGIKDTLSREDITVLA